MSEYQYYEWQTLERPLTAAEQAALNNLSSHIDVTSSQAVVTYNWGDFKHDPIKVLARYFDAHLYIANWGTRRLVFRFPKDLIDVDAIERPQDVLSVLAYLDEEVISGGEFEALIDPELVAVIGHFYGGYTSLAAAGARINTPAFKSHCEEAHASNHPAAWLCDEILPHLDDMAGLAGLDSTPEGLWPAWTDSRVDAIIPMAGDAFFFGQEGLAEINVPVMAIGGTADNDAPYEWGTHPSYENASSPRKVLISLTDAEHMIFTDPCERIPFYLKPFSGEFCSDPDWDRNYAHEIVSHFTTAFLLAELKQDANAVTLLAPDGVELPGMSYEAQGY